VINLAILSVIRRWNVRDHMTIREIVRCTGISRNTIRRQFIRGGQHWRHGLGQNLDAN
jgi:hypothetical protein